MTRSASLAVLTTSGLHDEREACLLLTTSAYTSSDNVIEYHADLADRISDELDSRNT